LIIALSNWHTNSLFSLFNPDYALELRDEYILQYIQAVIDFLMHNLGSMQLLQVLVFMKPS